METEKLLKLDLGCGTRKKEGFLGVDSRKFEGVDIVCDLGDSTKAWPWENDSVDDVNCSHLVEHFTARERIHFVNELHRVLKKGSKAFVAVPHWCSQRAYGDLTHQWPPVSEFWFYYLDKDWRAANAPHNDFYTCDFAITWGYALRPDIGTRNQEFQQFAMSNYKEACADMLATWAKK